MFEDHDSDEEEAEAAARLRDINSRNELVNPYWIENQELGSGPMGKLTKQETFFFQVCLYENQCWLQDPHV